MIDFDTFRTLYGEAKEYSGNEELYIMERGWQDWMDDTDSVVDTLRKIYAVSNKGFKSLVPEFRSLKHLCRWLVIPYGTAQKWASGEHEPSEYIVMLMAYATISRKGAQNGRETD